MSYILEALKKAERERRSARVPTLETAHAPPPTTRRRVWRWVVTAALGLNAVALILLLRPTPPAVTPGSRDATAVTGVTGPATERATVQPAPAAQPATEATSAGHAAAARAALPEANPPGRAVVSRPAPTEGTPGIDRQDIARTTPPAAAAPVEVRPRTPPPASGKPTVGGDVDPAETASRPPPGAVAVVPSEAGARPTGPEGKGRPAVRTALPAAPPPAEPKPAEPGSTVGPPAGDRASEPGPAEAAPRSTTPESRPTVDGRDETNAPVAAAPTPGEPSPGGQRAAAAKPPARAAAVAPREAAAPPAAPGDTPSTIQGRPAPAVLPDVPATVQEAFPRLTLDVLVYAETAEDRMVFINSRKYVEGQRVEGKLVIEGITRDGAVLSYQEHRFLLRPKSNPYLRSP